MRCLHGLDKEFCALCNGQHEAKLQRVANKKKTTSEIRQLRKDYLALLHAGELINYGEAYEDKEIELVLTTEYTRANLYRLAIELGRTRNAIKWVYIFGYAKDMLPRLNKYWKQIRDIRQALGITEWIAEFDGKLYPEQNVVAVTSGQKTL